MENDDASQSPWANMQYDVLVRVFMTLNMMDLITGVAGVCQSWRAAVKDPLLWEKVDFTGANLHPVIARRASYWADMKSRNQIIELLKTISKFSGDTVTDLYFSFFIYLDHHHLHSAAKRFPNLKRLALPGWNSISETGFMSALARLRNLETLTFPSIYSPINVMRYLREHCKNFTKLKLVCTFNYAIAEAVIKHLPNLKILSLRSSLVYKDALNHLVENSGSLVALNVAHCLVFEFSLPPSRRVSVSPTIEAHIIEKAKKFERFVCCDRRTCPRCLYMFVDDEGNKKWLEFQEEIWREDEFPEFVV